MASKPSSAPSVSLLLSPLDLGQLDTALETHIASLRRAVNTERDPDARAIRERRLSEYSALQNLLRVKLMEA